MSKVAFELRSQHKDTFDGGSFALPLGKTFDIGKALKRGKGKIVTDDPVVIDRLQRVDALKQVSAGTASDGGQKKSESNEQKGAEA